MKKLKALLSLFLVTLLLFATTGCYIVQAQKMKRVKGTYELTYYTRTDGKTSAVTNYIETYGYKVYLVVTGSSQGYCVYSDNDTAPYYYTCNLSYTYNEENSSLVDYVNYSYNGKSQNFAVTKGALNFTRPAIKLSENIASDGIDVDWKRVDSATDLSYVEEVLGTIAEYVAPGADSTQG